MTVCIAAIFRWDYSTKTTPKDIGTAVVLVSDRMITVGDIEYEPQQLKIGFITKNVSVLIAGDYSIHSEALKAVHEKVKGNVNVTPYAVAKIYGAEIQAIQRRHAEDKILAPLGLNTDSFFAQQKDMSDTVATSLVAQLQDHQGADVEAIVAGMEKDIAHIYTIDWRGTVRCYDDVGVAAIGIGGWHARSRLMAARYVNLFPTAAALASVYMAKKAAEIAPGVGKATDIHFIFRSGTEKLLPHWYDEMVRLSEQFEQERNRLGNEAIETLDKYIHDPKNHPPAPEAKGSENAQCGNASDKDGDRGPQGSGAPESPKDATDSAK